MWVSSGTSLSILTKTSLIGEVICKYQNINTLNVRNKLYYTYRFRTAQ